MPLLRNLPAALLLLACSAWASNKATFIRPVQQTLPAAGISQVVVQNLVGPIEVRIGGGSEISLVVLIHAGLRSIGVSALRTSRRSSLRPSVGCVN